MGYVLNALSEVASSEGKYDEAIQSAQRAADVYHGIGDRAREAYALNYRGIAEVQRVARPAAGLAARIFSCCGPLNQNYGARTPIEHAGREA